MQPGIAQLRLRLHPSQPHGLQAARRRGDRLVQQCGLPGSGLTPQHQGAAVALGGPGQQPTERLAFSQPADQHHVHTLSFPGAWRQRHLVEHQRASQRQSVRWNGYAGATTPGSQAGPQPVQRPDVIDQRSDQGAMRGDDDLQRQMIAPFLPVAAEPLGLLCGRADVQREYGWPSAAA